MASCLKNYVKIMESLYIFSLLIIHRTSGFLARLTAELFGHP